MMLAALALELGTARADEVVIIATPPPVVRDVPVRWELTDFRLRTDPPAVDVRLIAKRADGDCALDARGECQYVAVRYLDADAVNLMNALNTADLRNNSLRRRVLNKLLADGYLGSGTISGTPGLPTMTPTATPTMTWTATATAAATTTDTPGP